VNNTQSDFDHLVSVLSADVDALEDARMTLESIKEADPGTYDEIIDESLTLISKALSLSIGEVTERIADQLGVTQ
jgi:hypothetical protein